MPASVGGWFLAACNNRKRGEPEDLQEVFTKSALMCVSALRAQMDYAYKVNREQGWDTLAGYLTSCHGIAVLEFRMFCA